MKDVNEMLLSIYSETYGHVVWFDWKLLISSAAIYFTSTVSAKTSNRSPDIPVQYPYVHLFSTTCRRLFLLSEKTHTHLKFISKNTLCCALHSLTFSYLLRGKQCCSLSLKVAFYGVQQNAFTLPIGTK